LASVWHEYGSARLPAQPSPPVTGEGRGLVRQQARDARPRRRSNSGPTERRGSMMRVPTAAFAESGHHRVPPHAGVTEQSAVRRPSTLIGLTENQSVAEIQHMALEARSDPASRRKTHHGPPYALLEPSSTRAHLARAASGVLAPTRCPAAVVRDVIGGVRTPPISASAIGSAMGHSAAAP
jgi:hypothetical protein